MRSSSFVLLASFVALSFGVGCGGHRKHVRDPAPSMGSSAPAGPTPDLDAVAEDAAKAASSRRNGARQGDLLRGETMRPGEIQDFRVQMDAEHCYWFGGATGDMGGRITVTVRDPKGSEVASEKSREKDVLLEYCPMSDGIFKLESKLAHHGQFSVAVYSGNRVVPAVAAETVAGTTPEELIAKEALSSAPGAKQVGAFFEGTAEETKWTTSLSAGKCYWFIGAGQTGKIKKLSLYVWDPKNHRLSHDKAETNVATVGHCAKESGMFRFEAKIHSGKGLYKVAVYEKTAN